MNAIHTVPTREQVARRLAAEKAGKAVHTTGAKVLSASVRGAVGAGEVFWAFAKAVAGK